MKSQSLRKSGQFRYQASDGKYVKGRWLSQSLRKSGQFRYRIADLQLDTNDDSRNPFVSQVNSDAEGARWIMAGSTGRNPFVSQVNSDQKTVKMYWCLSRSSRNPFVSQVNSDFMQEEQIDLLDIESQSLRKSGQFRC